MILTRLHLENFKKYTTKTIEFGEGLIGIIGKNGSGKSTIFEAILFGLYGEAKKRGNKDLLRNASSSTKDIVLVELEFEFEGVEYKVVREFRGKAMSANAKFYKNAQLTTTGAKEVTTAIVNLSKMSKDAFMHTLFASQKELTSLSTLKNEDRKKMIRRLLGLEKIDFVEKELVEKSRSLKREIDAFAEVLLSDEDLQTKQESIKTNNREKEILLKDQKSKSQELDHIKTKEATIKKELVDLNKTKEHKQKVFGELELLKNSKSSEVMNQVKLSAELHELEHKQEALSKLGNLKEAYENLQAQQHEQEKLKEIHLNKEGLQKEQVQLREQYTKAKADIQHLQKECEIHSQTQNLFNTLELDLANVQENIQKQKDLEQALLMDRSAEQRVIDETKSKIASLKDLGRNSACPTCTRPLLEEYDNVINSLVTSVQNTHQKKIDQQNAQLSTLEIQTQKLEDEKKVKDKTFKELSEKLTIINSKLKDLDKEQEHFKQVQLKGLKNKEALKVLEEFSYDEKVHLGIKTSLTNMQKDYKHLLQLEAELKRVVLVKSDLKNTLQKIEELNKQEIKKDEEFKLIIYEDVKHKHLLEEHEGILKTIEAKTTHINGLNVQMAKIDGEIKTIQNAIDNNDKQLKKVQTKKDDLQDYEKIKTSLAEFKTKLNAKVAPRISSIASEMYENITKGKYQHIEVNNEFDFFIYDEGKKYPIERFSGGEIDLANLVLRIAISKTLTELSGASAIGFLAFDEVFGSQDEARRMEILEAFHTIKEQYRQIFLISHEMEIKEMFERVVEL